MTTLWSGRFDSEPDAETFEFGASFRFDRRLFQDDVRGSVAWAEALEHAGVLTASDSAAIARGLQEILASSDDPAFFQSAAAAQDEDVHAFVERELVERIG